MRVNSIIDVINAWMPGASDKDVISMLTHLYNNAMPSPTDTRDHLHYDKPDPLEKDWDKWVGGIEHQLQKPRCVAQGIEVLQRVKTNRERGVDCYTPSSGLKMADFDAQTLYHLCKQHDGWPEIDGTFPRMGMKMWKQFGLIELMPNTGTVHRCNEYWRCKNRTEAINDLLTIGPVTICVRWYMSYLTNGGILRPKTKDIYLGLHQMALTRRNAEDIAQDVSRGVNSHGIKFGIDGRFVLPDNQWNAVVTESWCAK